MIATVATLVFAAAGCASTAAIVASISNALPAVRRLSGERKALAADALALDRVYLVSLIETPLHDGTRPPAPVVAVPQTTIPGMRFVARVFAKRVAKGQARHGGSAFARRFTAARYHVAA